MKTILIILLNLTFLTVLKAQENYKIIPRSKPFIFTTESGKNVCLTTYTKSEKNLKKDSTEPFWNTKEFMGLDYIDKGAFLASCLLKEKEECPNIEECISSNLELISSNKSLGYNEIQRSIFSQKIHHVEDILILDEKEKIKVNYSFALMYAGINTNGSRIYYDISRYDFVEIKSVLDY